MAKREQKEALTKTKELGDSSNTQYQGAITGENQEAANVGETVAGEKEGLTSAYSTMGGNTQKLDYNPIANAGTVSTRPIDVGALNNNLSGIKEFTANKGGFTEGRQASIMEGVNNLKGMGGVNGGLSDDNISRIRGGGGYDEFAKTGGYTPESIANIKAQALSPIGSYATGTRDEMARRAAVSGGYAPGFDSANRQLQRDTARNIADTSLNANVAIQDKINAGRQWGIGGMSGAEGQLAAQQSGNRLTANQASSNIEMNLQDTISKYTAAGLSMEQATAKALSDFDAQNVGNEMNASMFNIGTQNDINKFNAGNTLSTGQFNITNQQGQQAAGLSGLQGLYNTDVGQYQNALDRRNSLMGGQSQSNLGYLNNQTQIAMQPSGWEKAMQYGLQGAGAAAGMGSAFINPKPK